MSRIERIPAHTGLAQIADDFVPRRFPRGGHAQTILGNFIPHIDGLSEPEERLFPMEADVQVLCHCHWHPERQSRMTLMIVHGLEGSSRSQYVIGTASRGWQCGWNVVRMNIRGCGGTEHLSSTLYHSGLSRDVEKLVAELIAGDGLRKVALAGFSMGGNQVLRAVGKWGRQAPPEVIAAAAVSPACDLALCSDRIHERRNALYEWWFMAALRAGYRRKCKLWPGHFEVGLLKGVRSVRDFDEHITARYMGFAGADDYYDKASSMHVLDRIAIPTLVVHADDDPFVVISEASRRKLRENPKVIFLNPPHGGHCAFLARPKGAGDDGRWAERKIVEFFARIEEATH